MESAGEPLSERPKRPTLYDVAHAAGVSHQTVSQVIRGGPSVRAATRERVERAVLELGYRPNLAARALASARSRRIGALFFDRYEQIGPTRNMQAAVDLARDAGYLVDVIGVEEQHPDRVDRAIELVLQSGVEGIIVFAPTAATIELVHAYKIPVPVVIEAEVKAVVAAGHDPSSDYAGMRLMTDYLADLGHVSVLHVTGPLSWVPAMVRAAHVRAVAEVRGVTVMEVEGDWTAQSGYDAVRRSSLEPSVTAVIASNDQMALGVMRAMTEAGLQVPADVSVVGHDDIPESAFFAPRLTTVREDFEGRGRVTMARLLEAIDPTAPRLEASQRAPELIIRESASSPRSRR